MKVLLLILKTDGDFPRELEKYCMTKGINIEIEEAHTVIGAVNRMSSIHFDAFFTQYYAVDESVGAANDNLKKIHEADEETRIVVTLRRDKYGSEEIRRLYQSGIYGAIFSNEATLENLLQLAEKGRTRKEARNYYGIEDQEEVSDVVDGKKIKQYHNYLFFGKDGTLKERLDEIKQFVKPEELTALLEGLNAEERETVQQYEDYADYFLKEGVRITRKRVVDNPYPEDMSAKAEIKDNVRKALLNITRNFAETSATTFKRTTENVTRIEKVTETIVEKHFITKRVVGVFGAYRGAGSTTEAIALAALLAAYEPITLMEIPDDAGKEEIFERLELETAIGPAYKSVPHLLDEEDSINRLTSNTFCGVTFFVAAPAYGPTNYSVDKLVRMINASDGNVIIDFGCSPKEAKDRGYTSLLTHVLVVYPESNEDVYLGKIRESIEEAENWTPHVLPLKYRKDNAGYIIRNAKNLLNQSARIFGNAGLHDSAISELLEFLNLTGSPKRTHQKKSKKVVIRGCTEVALFETANGCGMMHTALMLADSVRKMCRCAIIELDGRGKSEVMKRELGFTGKNLNLYGIDIYSDEKALPTGYKSRYDYVFLLFGDLKKSAENIERLKSCPKKYMLYDASPWNTEMFERGIVFLNEHDRERRVTLLASHITSKSAKKLSLYEKGERRSMAVVPYSEFPLRCSPETAEYLRRLLFIDS